MASVGIMGERSWLDVGPGQETTLRGQFAVGWAVGWFDSRLWKSARIIPILPCLRSVSRI